MSLDVWLKQQGARRRSGTGIFIRDGGETREITQAEWDAAFPGRDPVIMQDTEESEVYSANITHNLGRMAEEAGIYRVLWRPEEIGIEKAWLKRRPDHFKAFNPSNGWGSYEGLCSFVGDYLAACEQYPAATVHVSR